MDQMISFNNVDLEQIAPVRIVDVLVNPIPLSPVARQRPVHFGAEYVRMGGQPRTVSITFALLEMAMQTRQQLLSDITAWARSDQPAPLRLPNYPGRYLMAMCTALPEPSLRQWWESKLRLTFTAFDPYWLSDVEQHVACGTAFRVAGSVPPQMRIERTLTSAATNQAYSNGNQTMTFSNIPAGKLVIDLDRQLASVGGTSIMQYFSFASKFILPKTGQQTITGTGTVYWRERWD